MRVTLLGTGTPVPSTERKGSGYLVEIADLTLLFDAGPGVAQRLLEAGRQPTDLTHIVFSHYHFDHTLDYATLVLTRWDQGAGLPELEVFGPPPLARMSEKLFAEDGFFGEDIAARTNNPGSLHRFHERGGTGPRPRPAPRITEIAVGQQIDLGYGCRLTVGPAVHAQPYLECLMFRLDTPDGSVVYSGDSAPLASTVELATGCDLLIHMSNYRSGSAESDVRARSSTGHHEAATIARDAGAKALVLTHIPPSLADTALQRELLDEVATIYPGRAQFAVDLTQIEIVP